MIKVNNIFDKKGLCSDREQTQKLVCTTHCTLERVASMGHPTPENQWYDQKQTEWVMLAKGTATIKLKDNQTIDLSRGDHITIPAHVEHRVEQVSHDAVWIALFTDIQ